MNKQITFASKEELFKYLKDNLKELMADKMSEIKCADAVLHVPHAIVDKQVVDKSAENVQMLLAKDTLAVEVVINTTGLLDSHKDVHIPGLWNNSLVKQRGLYHLQEHKRTFTHVITDIVLASTKSYTWSELGFDFKGKTEALVFNSEIDKARNPFMFEQYARGYVKEHSVGMRYVQIYMCINSDEKYYATEKQNWDKYIEYVVNKEDAEKDGYFWAVTEAEVVEGSAVLFGSNYATPTMSVKAIEVGQDAENKDCDSNESMFSKLIHLN